MNSFAFPSKINYKQKIYIWIYISIITGCAWALYGPLYRVYRYSPGSLDAALPMHLFAVILLQIEDVGFFGLHLTLAREDASARTFYVWVMHGAPGTYTILVYREYAS